MISVALLAALKVSGARPALVEVPSLNAEGAVSVQAVVRLPKLDLDTRAALEICLRAAVVQTANYGPRDIFGALRTGESVVVDMMPDSMRIGLTVDKARLSTGFAVLESILLTPSLMDVQLEKAARSVMIADREPWARATFFDRLRPVELNSRSAIALWVRYVNRATVLVGAGGDFEPGSASAVWENRPGGWPEPPRRPSSLYLKSSPLPPAPTVGLMAVATGKPLLNGDPNIPLATLALSMLGTGKGSILWRVAREELGVSYRQEAFLRPDTVGWVPTVALATDSSFDGSVLRARLIEEAGKLGPDDLARAIGLNESNLQVGMPFSGLYWNRRGALGDRLGDEVYRAVYWQSKTGERWDRSRLIGLMKLVRLGEAKEWLSDFLGRAEFRTTGY